MNRLKIKLTINVQECYLILIRRFARLICLSDKDPITGLVVNDNSDKLLQHLLQILEKQAQIYQGI